MSAPSSSSLAWRDAPSLTAVLGPTNTGKTHLALDRMMARESGMIGLPLRLLAREVYDKIVRAKGRAAVALITGEEKIAPQTARYFVCTVEAMPVARRTAFVAIDEVQLAQDPERGHVFTQRLLHVRGDEETMLLGAATMRPLIQRLLPHAEHAGRERLSELTHTGPSKLTKLPRRSAIVAFSAEAVYAIAELLKRQRGGAAVVMGALSPRTRNRQVELYQSGEVDFLVATDAIGMGLNMDIDHVAFAALHKFDGRRRRMLRADEIAQIAGRAGRHTRDGAFGVTGDCPPMPEDIVNRVVTHEFQPVERLMWRNHELDYASVDRLLDSLNAPTPHKALRRVREAMDEAALRALADDPQIAPLVTDRAGVERLWNACQIPDFRKSTIDHHVRLTAAFARHLLTGSGCIPQDWAGAEIAKLDKTSGEVDALSARLAHIRTWTYAANRTDWFADPEHWRGVAREVEDRLSDALHENLTQRFVDRRTSALVRGLNAGATLEAHVTNEGDVVVEGHHVGRLDGLVFHPDHRGAALEGRALRNAALAALRPEIHRRLGALARARGEALALDSDGRIRWDGKTVGRLVAGPTALTPRVVLLGGEQAAAAARERAMRRLEAWVQSEIARDLSPLKALETAISDGDVQGLARGVAYRLVERLGALDRAQIADEVRALSMVERRALRALGIQFGEFMIFIPALVRPRPARLNALLLSAHQHADNHQTKRAFLPPAGRTSVAIEGRRDAQAYAAAGYRACGPRAVRFDIVERLAELARQARLAYAENAESKPSPERDPADDCSPSPDDKDAANPAPNQPQNRPQTERKPPGPDAPFALNTAMTSLLGCSQADLEGVFRALGYRRVRPRKGAPIDTDTPALWRVPRPHRAKARKPNADPQSANTPFAELAKLRAGSAASPSPRRRKRRPKAGRP